VKTELRSRSLFLQLITLQLSARLRLSA